MFRITKEFHFCASHALVGLEKGHPCLRLHGHNYVLKMELSAEELGPEGFVVDYRKLGGVKKMIDEQLDHKHLNEIFPFNTTVENMSKYFFDLLKPDFPQLSAIEMSETPKTNCRYESA